MVVRLAEFALQPSAVQLQPGSLLEKRAFRMLVDNLWRQLETVKDIPGKAIAVETRDPFCAMVGLVALWAMGGVGVPVDPQWPRHRKEQVCIKADVAARLEFDQTGDNTPATAHAK